MGLKEDILARSDLTPAVVNRDCEYIATAISVGRTSLGKIERAEFAIWAASTGMRAKIEDHAANATSPLRSIALSLKDFILGAAQSLDLSIPDNQTALQAWVTAGELSQAAHDSLIIGATEQVIVTARDVAVALYNDDGSMK